jgi:hypothetical protein
VLWVTILLGIIGSYSPLNWDRWTGFRENGSLWNWIQLLTAPMFISILPFLFGRRPEEPMQRTSLEAYEDFILGLMLNKDLRGSRPGSSVRLAARARTLTALGRVGRERQKDVLDFLHWAELIGGEDAIVDLHEADLSGADLTGVKLMGAHLSGADFRGARLSRADLQRANLRSVCLIGADLTSANLSGADLGGAMYSGEQLVMPREG